MKVTNAIKIAGLKIKLPYKDNVIPAEKASIEVATPIKNRVFKSTQTFLHLSMPDFSFASVINLKPK